MGHVMWTAQGRRALVAEAGRLQLVVTRLEDATTARFVVEGPLAGTAQRTPVRSGHRESVAAAMDAAEQAAERIEAA